MKALTDEWVLLDDLVNTLHAQDVPDNVIQPMLRHYGEARYRQGDEVYVRRNATPVAK